MDSAMGDNHVESSDCHFATAGEIQREEKREQKPTLDLKVVETSMDSGSFYVPSTVRGIPMPFESE